MTAEYMDRIHTSIADCDGGVYVPDVLQELVKNPTYVDNMKKIRLVAFGGAPLAKEAGDLLAKFTTVLSIIGSTEGGPYGANLLPDPQDWEWFQFDLVSTGLHFIHFHDDLYESVFKRIKHDNGANQPIFQAFPELDEYPTKDLWRAHKTKKDYWTHSGRVDDFVKLSSLTKFSANHIEKVLLRNNRVKGAVMGGDARPVPYLLVELADGEKEVEALDDLWVLIQEINATISTDIRLEKEMIFFTSPEKPMVRVNNKNTCQRRGTNELYANEVEGLYRRRAGFLNGSLQNGHSSIARSSKGTTAS
jgi:acyl-coenzyme A synthetase/AMP-(fatty) acid ligase